MLDSPTPEPSSSSQLSNKTSRFNVVELTPDMIKLYTNVFKMWEVTKPKKHILAKDLVTVMRALLKNPSDRQMKQYMEQIQLNGEHLSLDQFIRFMGTCDCPNFDDRKTLVRAFEVFDPEQTGYLPVKTFRQVLMSYGDPNDISAEEIEEMINTFGEVIPPIPTKKSTNGESTPPTSNGGSVASTARSNVTAASSSTAQTSQTAQPTADGNPEAEAEKFIFYGKFIKACLSNTTIHEKPVKKRSKSKSPKKK